MAFPLVLSTVTTAQTAANNIDVAMPAATTSGDLLLLLLTESANDIVATPSGWTLLNRRGGGGDNSERYLFTKIADGTEGGTTVNFGHGGSATNWAACLVQVGQWEGTVAGREFTVTIDAVSTNVINPSAETASWGVDDNLWVLFVGSAKNDATVTSWSTNYDDNQTNVSSGAGAGQGCQAGVATRDLAAATDDPDTVTLSTTQNDINAWLVVVQPGSSGGTGGPGAVGVGDSYNDVLHSYLIALGNTPGSINDMLLSQLESETGSTGPLNDLLFQFLVGKGQPPRAIDDMLFSYLRSLGHSGDLNQMLIASFKAGDFF